MITTAAAFDQETAWERAVLGQAIPLMPTTSGSLSPAPTAVSDLRPHGCITIGVSSIVGHVSGEAMRDLLLPLMFGAAWKVMDLALELALHHAGRRPSKEDRWTIKEKVGLADKQDGALPGMDRGSAIWTAFSALYVQTCETRHALVHRRVRVDPDTKQLTAFSAAGAVVGRITYDEQIALCRAAQRLAQVVVDGALAPRVSADLQAQLAVLHAHHGVPITVSVGTRPPVRVIDCFPANGDVDVPGLLASARHTFPGAHFVDAELHLAGGLILLAELDAAPAAVAHVDPQNLPPWIRYV
jgi:hypothetical protein